MTEATAQDKETRQGIHFYGKVRIVKGALKRAELYIEAQKDPVYVLSNPNRLNEIEWMGPRDQIVDKMFQEFVTNGGFYDSVRNPSHASILRNAQMERLEETPWYMRTQRFLPASDFDRSTREEVNLHFILTPDKSDLPRDLQIANTDSKSYNKILKHRKREEEREKLGYRKAKREEEKVRRNNSSEIEAGVFSAINKEQFPEGLVKRLNDLGLLDSSTSFRRGALYPGESVIFRYDLKKDGVRHTGYLGFDDNLELLSIDERLPQERSRYNDSKEGRFISRD